jgi:hypothetical protein
MKKLKKNAAWKALGFASFNLMCQAELNLDDRAVELILASKKGETLAQVLAADPEVKPLRDGAGRPSNGSDTTINDPVGRGAAYLVRRLKRDRPDIAEALGRAGRR